MCDSLFRLVPMSIVSTPTAGNHAGKHTVGQQRYSTSAKVQQCELLMMDTGESKTDAGDLWIMGLPFFRLLSKLEPACIQATCNTC